MTDIDVDPTLKSQSGQQLHVTTDASGMIVVTADGAEVLILRPNVALGLADALENACYRR
ncbi:hypothetical protein GII30_22210 [Gordonia amarae]|uniref:Uncharacterized protein n=1 Tax=Gordonia amarae TaxID=36821 RepID=A0A857L2N2_9ACTN|nr:hypothetical protein [Gordonia amarae]MCS3876499.1 hypothetical protein [Gordonia amarae]QHN19407.1 hypothetical protein GII35_22675 [Gordonia amarae]QHN23883.1 hypothetical protein GII34_22175 [Gordonia amarae]QHN32793.1 hypothetical protein GII32_22505 [Gordonia amarae]QHN41512.1 hypothetical protein GII30_22210 [Gordonia amarae]